MEWELSKAVIDQTIIRRNASRLDIGGAPAKTPVAPRTRRPRPCERGLRLLSAFRGRGRPRHTIQTRSSWLEARGSMLTAQSQQFFFHNLPQCLVDLPLVPRPLLPEPGQYVSVQIHRAPLLRQATPTADLPLPIDPCPAFLHFICGTVVFHVRRGLQADALNATPNSLISFQLRLKILHICTHKKTRMMFHVKHR